MDIRLGILSDVRSSIWVSLSSGIFRRHGPGSRCKEGRFLYVRHVQLRNRNGFSRCYSVKKILAPTETYFTPLYLVRRYCPCGESYPQI